MISKLRNRLIYRKGVYNNKNEEILIERINKLHDIIDELVDKVNELSNK